MIVRFAILALIVAVLATIMTSVKAAGRFEMLAKYRGQGSLVASAVSGDMVYLSYLYLWNTIDIVAVNAMTGEHRVYENPVPTESGARAMAVGPDGNIYLGTLPKAHFLKLDVKAGKLTDLGRPSVTESYIWDVSFGSDGRLYGATYPNAKLVRFDPGTGKLEDFGRMDPKEKYARFIAADEAGFVYVGIGTSKANIVAFEIATGKHRGILPIEDQIVGQAYVYRGVDGNAYGKIGQKLLKLEGWGATVVGSSPATVKLKPNRLRDGRTVAVADGILKIEDPQSRVVVDRKFAYSGNLVPLFRVQLAHNGELYGSTILPIHLVRLDLEKSAFVELGVLGGGEIFSILSHGTKLLMAAYFGHAPLMEFDILRPFQAGNPKFVNFEGAERSWRPLSMIIGPYGRVYLGAISDYGKLGGPLTVWDIDTGAVEQFHHVVRNQSVVSLSAWKDRIVGGTSIGGGGGSHPTESGAKLFVWDPKRKRTEFEIVPIEGAASINNLITAPNGLIYGFAGRSLFVFDPEKLVITERRPISLGGTIYNSVAIGLDGLIWGLAPEGIFTIDTKTNDVVLSARAPERITGGFAFRDNEIYFISGPAVYRYTIK